MNQFKFWHITPYTLVTLCIFLFSFANNSIIRESKQMSIGNRSGNINDSESFISTFCNESYLRSFTHYKYQSAIIDFNNVELAFANAMNLTNSSKIKNAIELNIVRESGWKYPMSEEYYDMGAIRKFDFFHKDLKEKVNHYMREDCLFDISVS
ncbi:MAG: hypothetical protein MK066_03335 [Crocinitomicaceae bacterium]|nr:hypothetical protein [Crocinitomicaceae bacterium]